MTVQSPITTSPTATSPTDTLASRHRRVGWYLAQPLVWLIRGYQLVISPMRPPTCRFYPSCSQYAVTALRRFGPLTGTWLAMKRLGRCHPWNPGGVDHVPTRSQPTEHPHQHTPAEQD